MMLTFLSYLNRKEFIKCVNGQVRRRFLAPAPFFRGDAERCATVSSTVLTVSAVVAVLTFEIGDNVSAAAYRAFGLNFFLKGLTLFLKKTVCGAWGFIFRNIARLIIEATHIACVHDVLLPFVKARSGGY
jgi:hypothetical protein